jgi:hypothetical protein
MRDRIEYSCLKSAKFFNFTIFITPVQSKLYLIFGLIKVLGRSNPLELRNMIFVDILLD